MISALAWIGEPGDETLLVGYRLRDVDGTTTKSSLFRCDFSGSSDPTCAAWEENVECYEIADGIGIDVSDIEVTADGVAYVSDYGRRPPIGEITGGAVYRWDVSMVDKTGASDTVTDISPAGGFALSGNSRVTGLLVGATYLYAFTPYGVDAWYSEAPRLWRIPTTDAFAGTGSAWITLSENDAKPAGEQQRDARFVETDTWADDQVARGNWAEITDGVFYGSESTLVGAGAVGVWRYNGIDSTGFDGHLGPADDDDLVVGATPVLDFAFADAAKYGDISAFQATVAQRGEFASDGRLHVAVGDMGYFRQDPGDRGVIPPQVGVFTSSGMLVDVVPTRDGQDDAVWLAMSGGKGKNIGVWRSADNGETFCFQAGMRWPLRYDDSVQFVGDHYDLALERGHTDTEGHNDADYTETGPFPDWPACDEALVENASEQGLVFWDPASALTSPPDDYPITGTPMAVSALDENVAVVAFQTSEYGPGGIAYTLNGAATWHWLTGPSDTECMATDKFVGEPILHLVKRYDVTSGVGSYFTGPTNYRLEMFFLGTEKGCLWRGVVTPAGETWTKALGYKDGCPRLDSPADFAISPWNDTLALWSSGYQRYSTPAGVGWKGSGGACLVDFDAAAEVVMLDPDQAPNAFAIAGMVPHPWVQDYWFVAPFVYAGTQQACVKERVFDSDPATGIWNYEWQDITYACEPPIPFALMRSQGAWVRAPLSIGGLPNLWPMDVNARAANVWFNPARFEPSVELAYATHGSGVFRGSARW